MEPCFVIRDLTVECSPGGKEIEVGLYNTSTEVLQLTRKMKFQGKKLFTPKFAGGLTFLTRVPEEQLWFMWSGEIAAQQFSCVAWHCLVSQIISVLVRLVLSVAGTGPARDRTTVRLLRKGVSLPLYSILSATTGLAIITAIGFFCLNIKNRDHRSVWIFHQS